MLEGKLEEYFQRIDEELNGVLSSSLKTSLAKFIFDDDLIKDPYKFAHQNKLDVESTLQLFLFFTEGVLPPLKMQIYIDCQNLECKSPIYLSEGYLDNNITCLHCAEEYSRADIQSIIKVNFKRNNDFFNHFTAKTPTCTFDVLKRSDEGLKPLPAILQSQSIHYEQVENKVAGVPLKTLTTLNTNDKEGIISQPLSNLEERFSRNMSLFKIQ